MYTPNTVRASMYVAGIIRDNNGNTLQAVLDEIASAGKKADRMHELIAGATELPGLQALLLGGQEVYDGQTEIALEQIEGKLGLTRDEIREGLRTEMPSDGTCIEIKQAVADYMQVHINRSLGQNRR